MNTDKWIFHIGVDYEGHIAIKKTARVNAPVSVEISRYDEIIPAPVDAFAVAHLFEFYECSLHEVVYLVVERPVHKRHFSLSAVKNEATFRKHSRKGISSESEKR